MPSTFLEPEKSLVQRWQGDPVSTALDDYFYRFPAECVKKHFHAALCCIIRLACHLISEYKT